MFGQKYSKLEVENALRRPL